MNGNSSRKCGYVIDEDNQRLVITTVTTRFTGLENIKVASATYITFDNMKDPAALGKFMTDWGNAWFNL